MASSSDEGHSVTPRTVLICGSKDWCDAGAIEAELSALTTKHDYLFLVHESAPGLGLLAAKIAERLGYILLPFEAEWSHLGDERRARTRNELMLDQGADLVLVFESDGKSTSVVTLLTRDLLARARRRGIPIRTIHPRDRSSDEGSHTSYSCSSLEAAY
jgi:hypothetical protein